VQTPKRIEVVERIPLTPVGKPDKKELRLSSGLPEFMSIHADVSVGLIGDGSEESAWSAAYALPIHFAPGEGCEYSQTNYALLGKIIDRLSGRPFTDFIAERQFAVAGMSDTRYADDRDVIPNRANSYARINFKGTPAASIFNSHLDWPPILRTAAGLHSTAEDSGSLAHRPRERLPPQAASKSRDA